MFQINPLKAPKALFLQMTSARLIDMMQGLNWAIGRCRIMMILSGKPSPLQKPPGGELIGQYTTPIRVVDEYLPKKIQKISDTTWMVDVGFNTTGWAEISMTAVKGTTVMLRYSEDFDENLEHMREYIIV